MVTLRASISGEEAKWAKHYSSAHWILLVGEGDFSFSLSLAKSFGSASKIVATSRDRYKDVVLWYAGGKSNLSELKRLGATVLHGVDATNLQRHPTLCTRLFDRIIFNFPHIGFRGKEDDPAVVEKNRKLVRDFLSSARRMLLQSGGQVHVTHKTGDSYQLWKIPALAKECGFDRQGIVPFCTEDYPGYCNKRGDGSRRDEPFKVGNCCTYMFAVSGKRARTETWPLPVVESSAGIYRRGCKRRFHARAGYAL